MSQNVDTSISLKPLYILRTGACPDDWTIVEDNCFSPARKTHEWKGSGGCGFNCIAVGKLCTDVGATLATKEETYAWLKAGGDSLGMVYGLTSTMKGNEHWFTEKLGHLGWSMIGPYPGCCEDTDNFFVCARPVVPGQ